MDDPDEYDYIIIGGGSAGCVLAARLTENRHARVALVEAGPPDKNPIIHMPSGMALTMSPRSSLNWAFETEPQKGLNGRRGYQPRGRVLGGSSSINAMVYIRGHPADYDHWASLGNEGWGWQNMLDYFLRAENQERGENAFHGIGGPLNVADLRSPSPVNEKFFEAAAMLQHRRNHDFNGAQQEGVGYYQVTQKNGQRCSSAKAYLSAAQSRSNLDIVTNALATRIIFAGRRAKSVEVKRNKKTWRLSARREIIISSGAFQSPQLLMLSGIGPAQHLKSLGIDVVHDLPGVGENLQDHIDYPFLCRTKSTENLMGMSPGGIKRIVKGLWHYARSRTGAMTSNFAESGGFLSSRPDLDRPDLQLHFTVAPAADHGRDKTILGSCYTCHVCLLRPQSRGTVRLADRDPHAAPLIDPAYYSHQDDLNAMVQGFKLTKKILDQKPLAALCTKRIYPPHDMLTDEDIKQELRNRSDTVYHPAGTCKMGADPSDASDPMSVVDDHLRVHGIEGLRVADASIMPTLVSGNTNAPTIAIAEKASDLIKNA